MAGIVAASGFLGALYAFNTAGVRGVGTTEIASIFALTALFFLSVQLILVRLSSEPEPQRLRIRSSR